MWGYPSRTAAAPRCGRRRGKAQDILHVADDAVRVAARDGAIVRVESRSSDELATGRSYDLAALVHEQSISTNTAAAGGNAQLMTMA